jgi:hypothetical protein
VAQYSSDRPVRLIRLYPSGTDDKTNAASNHTAGHLPGPILSGYGAQWVWGRAKQINRRSLPFVAIAHRLVDCLPAALAVDRGAGIWALVEVLLLALESLVGVEAIALQVACCVAPSTARPGANSR